jgi:hypothetical protein
MIYLTSNILGVQKTGINLINPFYILIYMQNKSGSGMAMILEKKYVIINKIIE